MVIKPELRKAQTKGSIQIIDKCQSPRLDIVRYFVAYVYKKLRNYICYIDLDMILCIAYNL